ncbi:MAG: hypothetical protein ACLRMW_06335 [[Clostridium] symbiosum]
MKKGKFIIFGTGMENSDGTGTWCQCSHALPEGNYDTILKGVLSHETADGLKQLELAFKVFRFEKQNEYYENLSEEGKKEESAIFRTGIILQKYSVPANAIC